MLEKRGDRQLPANKVITHQRELGDPAQENRTSPPNSLCHNFPKALDINHKQTHLQPVSTGARKHLVDAQHVERVGADAHVEVVLSGELGHVLVCRHAGGFEGLRGQLLLLVGDLKVVSQ